MRLVYILILALIHASCSNEQREVKPVEIITSNLLNEEVIYKAGNAITLKFQITSNSEIKLIIKNAFGSSIILPRKTENEFHFEIPTNYVRKSGQSNWTLFANNNSIQHGSFEIVPKTNSKPTLETYFGPRSITAGEQDFSMLVCVTTDPYDNVFPEDTEVLFQSQFLNSISEFNIPSKDLISWKNIGATKKSGRILVNTSFEEITSKELTTIVFPTLAEAFEIEVDRNHTFADGNQIMKLRSNVIRDRYDNIISDGTMVNFVIENSKGAILRTAAPSINGISKATILHPSEKEKWKIQAFVTGAAKSNAVKIEFETAVNDFEVDFSKNNRNIIVGPLRSFMKQLVPDGILIQLDIYSETGQYLETKKVSSVKGFGNFELPEEYHPNGTYHLVCKATGITKEYDVVLDER